MDDRVHIEAYCPYFASAAELLSRRWAALVLRALIVGPARFAELGRKLPGITDRMLSRRLQELEEDGFVERSVVEAEGSRAPHFAYGLTEKGRSLVPVLVQLNAWALEWVEPVPQE